MYLIFFTENVKRYVGEKVPEAWNDEQVVVHDCQARLSGYNYVSVLDFDEFLVPMIDKNFEWMIVSIHKNTSHLTCLFIIVLHVHRYPCPCTISFFMKTVEQNNAMSKAIGKNVRLFWLNNAYWLSRHCCFKATFLLKQFIHMRGSRWGHGGWSP